MFESTGVRIKNTKLVVTQTEPCKMICVLESYDSLIFNLNLICCWSCDWTDVETKFWFLLVELDLASAHRSLLLNLL